MAHFFNVTPPSVHLMILTLERRRLITRTPGEARSIRLNLSPEKLPPLQGADATTNIPARVRQADGHQPADVPEALAHLGKIRVDDLFSHNYRNPLDDSEFLPLLEVLIESSAHAGLGSLRVKELRRHACELYHRYCQEAQPESTFEENRELMFSYLPGSPRTHWRRAGLQQG